MSEKTNTDNITKKEESIVSIPVSEALKKNFMPYAMSVIVSRALPEIDGLKPSHRKLLYTMYEMGLSSGNRTKSANIAARAMLLNPHGDAGNYETMVRMTQNNETLLTPLVDGKGNFGKHYSRDMAYAASRYTEARLAPAAAEFFRGIRKDTVEFVDNYDGTRKEPVLLPVTFPSILANPTEGIAVGMASSIPSFNLSELCDAAIMRIKEPEKDIMDVMPAPDFTTGAQILYDRKEMAGCYRTGKGSFKMRSVYKADKKNRIIEISQIPFTTTAEAVIDGVITAVKTGKINEVSDVRNETDLKGLKIAIDYKRGTDPDLLMQKLFRLTKAQDTYSFNMTVLIDGRPVVLGVAGILDEWIRWRRECVKRELSFDLGKKQKELHLLEGLAKVLLDIDRAVRIIRETEDDEQVIPHLMEGFGIDEEQAAFIAEIKLRNLNRRYILEKTEAIEKLRKEIGKLAFQIGSGREIDRIIEKTLLEVKKKYGKERRTVLVEAEKAASIDTQDMHPDYPVILYRTKEGYLKKVAASSLRGGTEVKTKEDDEIVQEIRAQNVTEFLLFTDRCAVYKLYGYDFRDCRPSELGEYAANFGFDEGENLIYACAVEPGKKILIGFENGKVAKLPVSVYETKTKRKKLVNAYCDKSPVAGICLVEEGDRVGMLSSNGRLLIVDPKDIPEKTTKNTQGVQVLRLTAKNAKVTRFEQAQNFDLQGSSGFGYRRLPSSGGSFDGQMSFDFS